MMPHNERPRSFSVRQETALTSLLAAGSTSKAATAARVNPSTVRRWLADPDFQQEHRRRARLLAQEATSDLLAAQRVAVACLREALATGTPATRVRAGVALLELGQRATGGDFDHRLTELEERANRWQPQTGGRRGFVPLTA